MVKPVPGSVTRDLSNESAVLPVSIENPGPNTSLGIVRGDGADWFGPLNPMRPTAPEEVAGRRFDYPTGYNLWIRPKAYEGLPFDALRAFADSLDLVRIVIETRKDQVARLAWQVGPREKPKPVSATGVQPKPDPRIAAITKFFRRPDQEHTWDEWLRMLLEDLFVLYAPTLWKAPNRGGGL